MPKPVWSFAEESWLVTDGDVRRAGLWTTFRLITFSGGVNWGTMLKKT
jgi:hypothetical protein